MRICLRLAALALAFCLLVPLTAAHATALPGPASAAPTASSPVSGPSLPANASDREGADFQRWLAMSGQFNERLLSTVYWTLGALGAFFVTLLGYSWFVNFRLYERDKAAMQVQLRGEIATRLADIQADFDAQLARHLSELPATARDATTSAVAPIAGQLQRLTLDITHIKMDLLDVEIEKWIAQDIPANAIDALVKKGHLIISSDSAEYFLEDVLKLLEQQLDAIKPGYPRPEEAEIEAMLLLAPSRFKPICARIRKRIATRK